MFAAPSNQTTLFINTFLELDKYCQESLWNIQREVDQKNMGLIPLIQSSSFQLNQETQNKIIEIVGHLQKRAEAFRCLQNHVKFVLNQKENIYGLPNQAPGAFESILWILWKSGNSYYHQQVHSTLTAVYGSQTVNFFETFQHTNVKALEEMFQFQVQPEHIKNYINGIQNLYLANQAQPSTSTGHFVQMPQASKGFLAHFPQNPQNNGNQFAPESGRQAQVLNDQKPAMNVSHMFDFNAKQNGLQINVIKGVKKDNVEFYDQIQPALKASGELFTDSEFPPQPTSIAKDLERWPIATQVVWKRIPEIYKKTNITVCGDNIGPNDIHQGRLGNCFFLSALSALAERKEYIQRLFHSKGISSTGSYSIWLNDSGEWRNMIVDDLIPCTEGKLGTIPRFSRSKGNDMWVLLLEKAYAKLYKSYFGTSSGFQQEALAALTGAPTKYFKFKKNSGLDPIDETYLFLAGGIANKFVLTASSRKESETVNNKEMGVVSVHAYAILDVKEIDLPNGRREKLIKMRNPWGNREWKGEWGDSSPYWTPELKKQLNYEPQASDGVFWINMQDFHKHFFAPGVCQIHDGFKYSFIKLGENRKANIFIARMNVKSTGFTYVTVQQKRRKHYRGNSAYGYSHVRVMLGKLDANGRIASFIHAKYKNKQSMIIRRNLTAGNYLVFIEVDWIQTLNNELVLSSYSPVDIEFQEEPVERYHIPTLYEDFMRPYMYTSNDPKIKVTQLKMLGTMRQGYKHSLIYKFGLATVMYSNREESCELHYKVGIKSLNNMRLEAPEMKELTCLNIIVPPSQERFLILRSYQPFFNPKAYGYNLNESFAFPQVYTAEQLKQFCKEKGKKQHSFNKGQIEIYTFIYKIGLATYYVNNSSKAMIQDEVVFGDDNVLVNGQQRSSIEVFVGAGQEFLIDARKKDIFAANSKLTQKSNPKIIE